LSLDLQGSENISFVPIGSTTNVTLSSGWTSPSFNGSFLPKQRDITDAGFTSNWQVLELNRSFPQYWIDESYDSQIAESAFGTNLLLPLDDYQKSMRSAKYAIMTIGLTFLIFFMIEILNKRKIHPFQYILVGLSLSIFYVLLVSLSEHVSFNLSYLISTLAVVGMITAYSLSIFQKRSQTVLLSTVMTGLYGFMFVTLQLADYALLLGSIGLLVIIGLTMYFTRNINWYGMKFNNP
jgi:inner membrane protein